MDKTTKKLRNIAILVAVVTIVSFGAARIILRSFSDLNFERGHGFRSWGMHNHFGQFAERGNRSSFSQRFQSLSERSPSALVMLVIGQLGIITLGILGLFWINALARKINILCEGDGKKTAGAIKFLFLGIITFGIYNLLWLYMLGERLQDNAPRYNLTFKESGTMILLWFVPGIFILVGPVISFYIVIKNTNALAAKYNTGAAQPV